MHLIPAAAVMAAVERLRPSVIACLAETTKRGQANAKKQLHKQIRACAATLKNVPLSPVLAGQLWRLRQTAAEKDRDPEGLFALVIEFQQSLLTELDSAAYLMLSSPAREYYEQIEPFFGSAVHDCFPDAVPEIQDAGRCCALDQPTACVFHLMRALELALHRWAQELGVSQFSAIELENWQNILEAAERRVKELSQQPKGVSKDAALAHYGETLGHFRSIKDAWRNHTMHARVRYDLEEARSIMEHVKEFMRKLASAPSML